MARIAQSSIEQVVATADMVEVVGQYTYLRKAVLNFSGRCPFHEERTPSFSVNPVEKLYYCFGCGAGGNLIGFVMAKENMDFPEAVEYLAGKYGIALDYDESSARGDAERRRRERLREVLGTGAGLLRARPLGGRPAAAPAREYLEGRGLPPRSAAPSTSVSAGRAGAPARRRPSPRGSPTRTCSRRAW